MQTTTAGSLLNPYASPAGDIPVIQAEIVEDKPKHGSLALILLGFVLLLVGYMAGNVFAIFDLYQIGMGPDGEAMPSPISELCPTPASLWLFYGLCAAATIAGCLLIGSQNFNPLCAVVFFMCPIAGLVFLLATPLRTVRNYVVPVAAVYLMIGTCLAGVGLTKLIGMYGQPGLEFEPILCSLALQAGLAMLAGAMLKLARTPPEQQPAPSVA
jgi:hypothetical protein